MNVHYLCDILLGLCNSCHIIIIIIIIILACWDKPSRHEDIRKKVKITNCNRLAGSERVLEWDRISPL